jgi:hypothetical protein
MNNVEEVKIVYSNGRVFYVLPSIFQEDQFYKDLTNVMSKLNPSDMYKIYYYAYLITNNEDVLLFSLDDNLRNILKTHLIKRYDYDGLYLVLNDLSKGKDVINSRSYGKSVLMGISNGRENINERRYLKNKEEYVYIGTKILVNIYNLGSYNTFGANTENDISNKNN